MAGNLKALMLAVGLTFVSCGGKSATDGLAPDGGEGGATGTGGSPSADACDDAGAADAGCGGEGGDHPLEPYARLRTACNTTVTVNRRGPPVRICDHIH
ncbi:MAG: hypothetical protein ABI488_13665 [Polyangiaceae bacterium]